MAKQLLTPLRLIARMNFSLKNYGCELLNWTGTVRKVTLISTFTAAVCESWNVSDKHTWDNAGDLTPLFIIHLQYCCHPFNLKRKPSTSQPTHFQEIFRKLSHRVNTNKGSIVKQSGNDVEGCRSQKFCFNPIYAYFCNTV